MPVKTNTAINGSDYFRITRTIGHKIDEHGDRVPVKKQFYGSSKKDAEIQYDIWKEKRKEKEKRRDDILTPFGDLAKIYTDNVLKTADKYAAGTKARYIGSYKNYVAGDDICSIPLCDLTALDIQKFYNRLDCTKQTIKQVHKYMAALFKWMSLNNYCPYLLAGVEMPEKKEPHKHNGIEIWTDDELQNIIDYLGDYRLRLFIILCNFTGLRISEQFGLKYSDFDGQTLHINRQYNLGEIKAPKDHSYRDLPVHPILQQELDLHRSWHEDEMNKYGYSTDYVFTSQTGRLLEAGNVRRSLIRYYNRIVDDNGEQIVPYRKFHAYRATFCTRLCRAGVPIQTASKLMGHKSVEVTLKYYTDVDMVDKKDAVSKLPPLILPSKI